MKPRCLYTLLATLSGGPLHAQDGYECLKKAEMVCDEEAGYVLNTMVRNHFRLIRTSFRVLLVMVVAVAVGAAVTSRVCLFVACCRWCESPQAHQQRPYRPQPCQEDDSRRTRCPCRHCAAAFSWSWREAQGIGEWRRPHAQHISQRWCRCRCRCWCWCWCWCQQCSWCCCWCCRHRWCGHHVTQ